MQFNKNTLAILISAIIAGVMVPTALAQENNESKKELTATEKAKQKKAKNADIERIIVSGYEASLDAAEEKKRNSDEFLDAVSASGLGEFADDSVGDALNSISGIDIDTNNGIADGIYVGGLPPEYNEIQINGNTLGAGTNDSASFVSEGATTSGIFSTAVLSGLEVYKSARADKSEGSLGGTVNFKTWKPLNFKKPRLKINLSAGYHELDEATDGKASFLYGARTDDEKFGWVLTASHDVTKGRIDTFTVSDQRLRIYDIDTTTEGRETAFPYDYSFRVKDSEKTRTNLVMAFQYQVNEDLTLGLEANYAKLSRFFHEQKNRYTFKTPASYFVDDSLFTYQELSSPNESVERMMTSGVLFNGNHSIINFERDTEDEAKGLNFTADWIINDNWDMQLQATYSKNSFSWSPNDKAQQTMRRSGVPMLWQSGVIGENSGLPEIYFLKDDVEASGRTFNYDQYPDFDINNRDTWAQVIDATPTDYSQYLVTAQSADTKDNSVETATIGTDFTYYVDNSDIFNLIKFGFKYTYNQSNFAKLLTNSNKVLPASQFKNDFSMTDLGELTQTEEFFGGHNLQGVPLTWMSWNWDTFNDAIWNNGAGDWPGLGITDIPEFMTIDSQHVTEMNSIAAYLLTSFDVGQLTGNVGVRYAYDDYYAYSYNASPDANLPAMIYLPGEAPEGEDSINEDAIAAWNNPDNFYLLSGGRKKGYFLPSLNLRYELVDDVFLRFSAARTMSRAPVKATQAKANISYGSDESAGDFLVINAQNPALEPTFSRNYDLGIEWYLPKQGSVTLAIRHKNLYNVRNKEIFIFNEGDDPSTGLPYEGDEIHLTRQVNDGSGKINTVEFGIRQKLKFLPGIFQHTGVNFNATYTDSDVTKPTPTGVIKLTSPARIGFNAQLYYQHKAITTRLAYTWREARISRIANEKSLATLDDYRRRLNFSSSYKFNKHFKVSFNIQNVLDASERRLSETGGLLVGETLTGRRFLLSGHYTM